MKITIEIKASELQSFGLAHGRPVSHAAAEHGLEHARDIARKVGVLREAWMSNALDSARGFCAPKSVKKN